MNGQGLLANRGPRRGSIRDDYVVLSLGKWENTQQKQEIKKGAGFRRKLCTSSSVDVELGVKAVRCAMETCNRKVTSSPRDIGHLPL